MQINLTTVFFVAILLIALHLLGRHGYVDICCCPESVHETTVIIDTITRHSEIFVSGADIPAPTFERSEGGFLGKKNAKNGEIPRDTLIKIYRDTIYRDGLALTYLHRIRGDLISSKYSIKTMTERPIILRTTTHSAPATRAGLDLTFPDFWRGRVYGMMGYHGITRDVGIGGAYVGKDYIFTYMYGLGDQTHSIGAGLRLF